MSILALVPLLYSIIEAPDRGWSDGRVVGGFVVAAAFITLFAWWERRCDDPMLDVRRGESRVEGGDRGRRNGLVGATEQGQHR